MRQSSNVVAPNLGSILVCPTVPGDRTFGGRLRQVPDIGCASRSVTEFMALRHLEKLRQNPTLSWGYAHRHYQLH